MFVPILLYSRHRGSSGIISSAIFSASSFVLPINCIIAFILPSLTCSLVANSLLCWSWQWMQYLSSNLDVVFSSSGIPQLSHWFIFASSSHSQSPKVLFSVSIQTAAYPIPGIAVLGTTTLPPSFSTLAICSSTDGTST